MPRPSVVGIPGSAVRAHKGHHAGEDVNFLSFERNSAEFKGPAVQVKVGLLLDHGEADHQRYILEPPEDGPEDQRLSVSVLTWRFW